VLPIAASLKEKDPAVEILFIGSQKPKEREWVRERGVSFRPLPAGKWRRYFDLRNISDLFLTFIGFLVSSFLLLTFKPDIIFIKGGYVGVPVGLAAKVFGVPYVLHESDAVLGAANRFLASKARAICTAFPLEVYHGLPAQIRRKLVYTGLPVRQKFFHPPTSKPSIAQPLLLIMGGSQGAHQINNLVRAILPRLLEKFKVVHQAGKMDFLSLDNYRKNLPKDLIGNYELYDFKPHIDEDMKRAALVVSRAGATSIFELATAGKPAILIPLPGSANSHQERNAQILLERGAAEVLTKGQVNSQELLKIIENLLADKVRREKLSRNISRLARFDAASKIAGLLLRSKTKE